MVAGAEQLGEAAGARRTLLGAAARQQTRGGVEAADALEEARLAVESIVIPKVLLQPVFVLEI